MFLQNDVVYKELILLMANSNLNSSLVYLAQWCHMTSKVLFIIGSGKGMVLEQYQAISWISDDLWEVTINDTVRHLTKCSLKNCVCSYLYFMKAFMKMVFSKLKPICSGLRFTELIMICSGLSELTIILGLLCSISVLLPVDVLVQERRNSSALAMELRLSCTSPSMYSLIHCGLITPYVGIVVQVIVCWLTAANIYLN